MEAHGNTPSYRDEVRLSLARLNAHGVRTSDGFKSKVEAELGHKPRGIGAAIYSSIVLWLASWLPEKSGQKHLMNLATATIALIECQEQWPSCWTRDTKVRIFRVARRLFFLVSRGDCDWETLASRLLQTQLLPTSACLPQTVERPCSTSTVVQFLRDATRLTRRIPVVTAELDSAGSGSQEDTAISPLTPNCPTDCLRPALAAALRLAMEKTSRLFDNEAQFFSLVLLEALYGMHYKDALCLRFGDTEGTTCPGRLTRETLVLHVGGGYFPNSDCWVASELVLPLVPQLTMLLDQAKVDFGSPGSLGDAFGATAVDDYLQGVRHCRDLRNDGAETMQGSFVATFDVAALLECGIEPAVLSLLRGRPLYGSRGRCSYVVRSGSQLRRTLAEIQAKVLEMCGMDPLANSTEQSDLDIELHGTPSDSFVDLVGQFKKVVESANTHNTITRCVEHLMLLLGMRRTATHPNPAWFLRRIFGEMLCFSDKQWIDGQAHRLPCGVELLKVITQCARIFGASRCLLFAHKGQYVSSLAAPDESRIPFPPGYPFQPFRNGLINQLIEQGTSTIVIDYMVGQNSASIAPTSGALPVSEADLQCAAEKAMDRILRTGGLGQAIALLGEKLMMLGPVKSDSGENEDDEIDRFASGGPLSRRAASAPTPLSFCEDGMAQVLIRGFSARYGQADGPTPTSPAHILIATMLATGISCDHLLRYRKYITCKNFLRCGTEMIFLAPMPTEDCGGLSYFPIRIDPCYGVEGMVEALLTLRERDYAKRKVRKGLAAGVRPFAFGKNCSSGEDKFGGLAQEVSTILRAGGLSQNIESEEAVRLLSRIGEAICRYRHSGTVWAVMVGTLRAGLNHFRVGDCLYAMGVAGPVSLLDGSPWEDVVLGLPAGTPHTPINIPPGASRNAKLLGQRVAEIFHRRGLAPSLHGFEKSIRKLVHVSGKAVRIHFWVAAHQAMRHSLERGWLIVSNASKLIEFEKIRAAHDDVARIVARTKPKKQGNDNADPAAQRDRKKDQLHLALEGILLGMLRPSEAKLLPEPSIFDGSLPNVRFVVRSQKGKGTTGRHVDTSFTSFGGSIKSTRGISRTLGAPKVEGYGKALISDDTLSRCIGQLFGEAVSPYCVRHSLVIKGLAYLISHGLTQSGSLLISLGTLAKQLGHSNLTVAPCSYAGVALAILSRALNRIPSQLTGPGWQQMLESAMAARELERAEQHRRSHRAEIKRRYTACRKLIRSTVITTTGCLQGTVLVVTSDTLPLMMPDQLVVELPAGLDETALQGCIHKLWTVAQSKNIAVVFRIYEPRDERWNQTRMQALVSRLSRKLLVNDLS